MRGFYDSGPTLKGGFMGFMGKGLGLVKRGVPGCEMGSREGCEWTLGCARPLGISASLQIFKVNLRK